MQWWTKDILVDPTDATQNTWYVGVFSGWGGGANDKGGLYKTTNRGTSWAKIFDAVRIESFTINPANPNEMYVTTEYEGLYLTKNLQSSNPDFNIVNNYPFKHPMRIFFNPYNNNEIFLTSFGYGVVQGTLGNIPPILPKAVILLSPNDGSSFVYTDIINFLWNKGENVSKYYFEYADNPNFLNSTFDSTIIDTANILTNLNLYIGKNLYWRVKAGNKVGWGPWSEIRLIKILSGTDIQEFINSDISIFPNPATDYIFISISTFQFSVSIFNLIGEIVLEEKNNKNIDLSKLTSGIYYCLVKTNEFYKAEKLIIMMLRE